ncbi:MAG: endonuclease [Deltaproteobacteria bacterium]|nr:endonuclease [Deltaproteobacteria bacterium]
MQAIKHKDTDEFHIINKGGGILCYLSLFAIILALSLPSCGDFVRDGKLPRDRDIVSYLDLDTYPDISENENNIFTDISEDYLDSDTSDDIQIHTDTSEDIVITEDIISSNDIFHNTEIEDSIGIIEDSIYSDTGSSEITTEPETYTDASDKDTDAETNTDNGITCDCDAGYNCGRCYYPGTEGLKNKALKDKLNQLIKNHTSLGYNLAREKMFVEIDNKDGWVECVYTGFRLQTNTIPNPNIMNTEHTWPQSMGADNEPARSDLFHLFPTKSEANSRRGNYPFGTVVKVVWSDGGSKLGTNAKGNTVFEPRDIHKGNTARAMFYFSIRYSLPIDNEQESELRKWHFLDPVDNDEMTRCNMINYYQKNRNPFVDWPQFVNDIDDF